LTFEKGVTFLQPWTKMAKKRFSMLLSPLRCIPLFTLTRHSFPSINDLRLIDARWIPKKKKSKENDDANSEHRKRQRKNHCNLRSIAAPTPTTRSSYYSNDDKYGKVDSKTDDCICFWFVACLVVPCVRCTSVDEKPGTLRFKT
jgi:hypothetical protein